MMARIFKCSSVDDCSLITVGNNDMRYDSMSFDDRKRLGFFVAVVICPLHPSCYCRWPRSAARTCFFVTWLTRDRCVRECLEHYLIRSRLSGVVGENFFASVQ